MDVFETLTGARLGKLVNHYRLTRKQLLQAIDNAEYSGLSVVLQDDGEYQAICVDDVNHYADEKDKVA
jgi:hypothetical protein